MSKKILAQNPHIIIRWCLCIFFCAGALGCGGPTPVATPAPLPPCTPEPPSTNIYSVSPNEITLANIQLLVTSTPDPLLPVPPPPNLNSESLLRARYAALMRLENEAKRWTNTQVIDLGNSNKVYFMVTFLHPNLIQAITVSNILMNNPGTSDIQAGVYGALGKIAEKKDFIFLITVFANNSNGGAVPSHKLTMVINEMAMINAKNIVVRPEYDDHNLDQPIDLSGKPEFGYFYYPMAVIKDAICTQVLDPQYNTKINIQTNSIAIDGVSQETQTWTIPYSPLLDMGIPYYTLEANPPALSEPDKLGAIYTPPITFPTSEAESDTSNFWRDFGRYVWGQVTLENY